MVTVPDVLNVSVAVFSGRKPVVVSYVIRLSGSLADVVDPRNDAHGTTPRPVPLPPESLTPPISTLVTVVPGVPPNVRVPSPWKKNVALSVRVSGPNVRDVPPAPPVTVETL